MLLMNNLNDFPNVSEVYVIFVNILPKNNFFPQLRVKYQYSEYRVYKFYLPHANTKYSMLFLKTFLLSKNKLLTCQP